MVDEIEHGLSLDILQVLKVFLGLHSHDVMLKLFTFIFLNRDILLRDACTHGPLIWRPITFVLLKHIVVTVVGTVFSSNIV